MLPFFLLFLLLQLHLVKNNVRNNQMRCVFVAVGGGNYNAVHTHAREIPVKCQAHQHNQCKFYS